ncbi:VWA domain-containing protein [Tolumonas lignilytica]|uniref:VWA domain-containing protein n=1 Tax=Tolumonas lignilytica TaxID=1283284 RepID=UPI0004659A1C|nr:VWA domain-containing protein [Tolumonas lignilytica]
MTDIIFLRPYAFALTIPLFILFYFVSSRKKKQQSYISLHLLSYLTQSTPRESKINIPLLLFVFCILSIIALAGPALPQKTTLVKSNTYSIVLVGMDKTMYADDIKPSRLILTKQKIDHFLTVNPSTNTALIAFSGSAHIISPFTDDHGTLIHFIDALNPSIMPESGSNIVEAIKLAASMVSTLKQNTPIKIILVTDQLTSLQSEKIVSYIKPLGWPIDIVSVGTLTGSVALLPSGGLLRTPSGQLIVAKTPMAVLADTANRLGGKLIDIKNLDKIEINDSFSAKNNASKDIIIYKEISYYFLLPLIILALCFRQGYILCLVCLLYTPKQIYAKDLAMDLYKQGHYQQAGDEFQDYTWKGNAMYRSGNFEKAIQFYEKVNTATAYYNKGNALAHLEKIKEAITAYNHALQLNPQLQEAKDNKKLLEDWLKNQSSENKTDEAITELEKKNGNLEKALNFLRALPEEPGNLLQKRLQLQQKNKSN